MPSAERLCPRTVELVRSVPDINAAAFTLLPPGGTLGKHRDPFAASLRYHLGLVTPNSDDCRIWVDGHEHSWRDGKDFVFDETFVHWAQNDTDETRIIFFADFTRPLHTRVMRAFNRFMIRYVFGVTRSKNRPGRSRWAREPDHARDLQGQVRAARGEEHEPARLLHGQVLALRGARVPDLRSRLRDHLSRS